MLGMVSIAAPSLQGFTNILFYSHIGWSLRISSFWNNLSCRVAVSLDYLLCKVHYVIDARRNIHVLLL